MADISSCPVMTVYRLRVVIAGISPLVWRRLEVPVGTTVAGLHAIVQAVFGWSGEHLHRFGLAMSPAPAVHCRDGSRWCSQPGRADRGGVMRAVTMRLGAAEPDGAAAIDDEHLAGDEHRLGGARGHGPMLAGMTAGRISQLAAGYPGGRFPEPRTSPRR